MMDGHNQQHLDLIMRHQSMGLCPCESEEALGSLESEAAKPARPRGKRSCAAEVHNLSEKRRRSRINEKMKALQSLIPNSSKTDKASMLDDAIEYLKQLQLQVQEESGSEAPWSSQDGIHLNTLSKFSERVVSFLTRQTQLISVRAIYVLSHIIKSGKLLDRMIRFHTKDVGLVIDGQSGWVPGYLRRVVKPDGYIYGTTILFGSKELIRASKDKTFDIQDHPDVYIVTKDVDIIDYRGNYDGSICRLHLSEQQLQSAIHNISSHEKGSSFHEQCHYAFDILVLFGPEVAKFFLIFQYTMESLCEDVFSVRIPPFLDATVIKFDKVSQSTFNALLRSALTTNDEEASKIHFEVVRGVLFRKLTQCIETYPILRRPRCFRTRFFLLDMAAKFRQQKKKPEIFKRPRGEREEELSERQREENLKVGTLFDTRAHEGVISSYVLYPMPSRPLVSLLDKLLLFCGLTARVECLKAFFPLTSYPCQAL